MKKSTQSPKSEQADALVASDRADPVEKAAKPLTEAKLRAMPQSAYMNVAQLAFFRQRLLQIRSEVASRQPAVPARLIEHEVFADPSDRASAEEEHSVSLRLIQREAALIRTIDDALNRIRSGAYGYCTASGEAIGIPRLLARPTAAVCVGIKDRDEKLQSHFPRR